LLTALLSREQVDADGVTINKQISGMLTQTCQWRLSRARNRESRRLN
jgi:hypothetical protein